MSSPVPETPDTQPTKLFFPVMSTLLFIGLAIYELPGFYGWIYLAIAIFGVVTVYLSWQGNKKKQLARKSDADAGSPRDKQQEGN